MKSNIKLTIIIGLFLIPLCQSRGQSVNKNTDLKKASYVSLNGEALSKGNPTNGEGNVSQLNMPLLRILRSRSPILKGSILLVPGGNHQVLWLKNEGKKVADLLNKKGFDVAILDYHIATDTKASRLALVDALKAFRLLKDKGVAFGLHIDRLDMLGFFSGGNLAARTVQRLAADEQPDNLLIISPTNMDDHIPGTVFYDIMPPIVPKASLFTFIATAENKALITRCSEYTKTWKGYDGTAIFTLLADSTYTADKDMNPLNHQKLMDTLNHFLSMAPAVRDTFVNPATVPVPSYSGQRHKEKVALVAKQKYDLILIGNSITNNFEKPQYQPVWNQFFAPRNTLNLGFSGYRTENILWNLQNGELEGQSPKVVTLEIGTNNVDEKNYPTRHTAGQLAGGITAIVKLLRQKLPDTKIILLRCFPGCYGGPNPTSHRAILERASDIVAKLADGQHVFYCDVNHVFLNMDGSINHDMMSDWLHPTPAGAKAWAQAMEPLLSQLMGDRSLDTEIPQNTAIVPITKLESDSYNWFDRHAEVLRIKDTLNPQIILIGNSITHFWGGLYPQLKYSDGRLRKANGPVAWQSVFGSYKVLNLGFGWDRTQNALWRLDHGEVDGLHPQTVVIDIGTNNTSQTNNARINTAPEIVEGIKAVYLRVRSKLPGTKIILMAIFPRDKDPLSPRRALIKEINQELGIFANENKVTLVNIGPGMLAADGTFLPGMMLDYTHPTDKGYQVWADAIRSYIDYNQ